MMIMMMMMMIMIIIIMIIIIIIIIIVIIRIITIIIIIIIIIIIMFYNLHSTSRTVSNTYAQVALAQSCPNHMRHFESLSHATYVSRDTKGQLSCEI